jgi:hypothetical protein
MQLDFHLGAGPKKPLNADMIFASEHRATVKEENATFSAPAIAKLPRRDVGSNVK